MVMLISYGVWLYYENFKFTNKYIYASYIKNHDQNIKFIN